jgi:hypothetical protein
LKLITSKADNGGGAAMLVEFKAKLKVLVHYEYLDSELNLQFKGKVASLIQDPDLKFLMTELIFSGILKEVTDVDMLALMSLLLTKIFTKNKCVQTVSPEF